MDVATNHRGRSRPRGRAIEPQSFTKADGATLSYTVLGSKDATSTVVCHPGGPGMSAAYFGDLCGLGSERLRVVLFKSARHRRFEPTC